MPRPLMKPQQPVRRIVHSVRSIEKRRTRRFQTVRFAGISVAGTLCALAGTPALAQISQPSLADVAQQESVLARSKSAYDPSGIPIGSFQLLLSADTRVTYDSNIYNTSDARADGSVTFAPRAELKTQSPGYDLYLSANASIQRYAKLTSENNEQYDLTADGRLSVGSASNIYLGGFYGRHSELRGSLGDIVIGAPNQYDRFGGRVGIAVDLDPFSVSASGTIETFNYLPVRLNGTTVSQDYRDRTAYSATMRLGLAAGPSLRVFAQGDYDVQDYRQLPGLANQDSHGYSVVGGVAFGLSELMSGEVAVGYLSQRYEQGAPATVGGVTYRGKITWNVTTLLTATLSGGRTLEQSPFFNQAGIIEDSIGINLDYELLRNVIISASQRFIFDDYRGIDRNDRRSVTEVSARFLFSRALEAGLRLNHRDQSSNGDLIRPYSGTSVMFSLVIKR